MKIKATDKTLCVCPIMILVASGLQNILWIHEVDRKKKKKAACQKSPSLLNYS